MVKTSIHSFIFDYHAHTHIFFIVNVTNFHTSWRDGLAFCALIARFRPDQLDFSKRDKSKMVENLTVAFTTAEKLGIPALLDVEGKQKERSAITTLLIRQIHMFYRLC